MPAMQVEQVAAALGMIAPPEYAADWDRVGLLVGGGDWEGSPLLLTIDLTAAVLREAIEGGARMIAAYHPPIFDPLVRLTAAEPRQRIILDAARQGIAIYSPHTALDAAPGGVNDWIAGDSSKQRKR